MDDLMSISIIPSPLKNDITDQTILHIKVRPDYKVKEIKKVIENEKGFPMNKQTLLMKHFEEDVELENDRCLKDCGVQDRECFKLMTNNLIIDLVIKTNSREVILENVHCLFDSLCEIKERIQRAIGFMYAQSVLLYDGTQIDDKPYWLSYYKIKHQSTIVLGLQSNMHVFIKVGRKISGEDSAKQVLIECKSTITIKELKDKIAISLNQPFVYSAHFDLFYNKVLLDDEKCLLGYDVENESVLKLKRRSSIQISINSLCLDNNVPSLSVDVELEDTIKSLKNKIKASTGIKLVNQRLYFNDRFLDDKKKIKHYSIEQHSVIILFVADSKSFPISIESYQSPFNYKVRRLKLMVKPTNTVEDVKYLINLIENKLIDKQRLFLNDRLLGNRKQLKECGVSENSVLVSKLNIHTIKMNGNESNWF